MPKSITSEPLAEIRKRRIFCPLTETSGGVDVKSVAEQSEDAVGGEDGDTEHQMAERLEMAADPQVATTELILDAGIGTFGRASLVIGQVPLESAEFSATLLRLVTCAHSRRARVR
jgi:hypothetical protein